MAQIIRNSIEENIPNLSKKSKIKKERDKAWKELMSLSGIIKGEPKDISSNLSKYLGEMYRAKT